MDVYTQYPSRLAPGSPRFGSLLGINLLIPSGITWEPVNLKGFYGGISRVVEFLNVGLYGSLEFFGQHHGNSLALLQIIAHC